MGSHLGASDELDYSAGCPQHDDENRCRRGIYRDSHLWCGCSDERCARIRRHVRCAGSTPAAACDDAHRLYGRGRLHIAQPTRSPGVIPNRRFIHRLGLSWADASRAPGRFAHMFDQLVDAATGSRAPAAVGAWAQVENAAWRGGWPPSPTSSSGCGLRMGPPIGSCGASTTGMRWRRRWPPPRTCRWGWPRINSASPWSCGTCRGSRRSSPPGRSRIGWWPR